MVRLIARRPLNSSVHAIKPMFLLALPAGVLTDTMDRRRLILISLGVHDGIGICLCARRLNQGRFLWANASLSLRPQDATTTWSLP